MSVARSDSRHLPISWGMRGEGVQAGMLVLVCMFISVCLCVSCALACVYLLEPHVWISSSPCTHVSPLKCVANSRFESHHRDVTA